MKRIITLIIIATLAPTTFVWAAPAMQDVIIPKHMQGINGTNNRRVPYAFRVKFTDLTPNATYRYINQVVLASESTTANGAGNMIFVNSAGNFYGTSSPTFTAAGGYGEFTTDASGEAEAWMITEPTGNTLRFVPGSNLYMRVRINDGAGGTTIANRFTTTESALIQDLTTASSSYSAIRGESLAAAKDFVLLYDNIDGTGRPLAGTLIESDGYTVATSYAAFYQSNVDGQAGRWGAVTPNNNAAGVRRIERRSLLTGSIIAYNTDDDGIWPSGANTVNPTNGESAIVISSTDAPIPEPGVMAVAALAGLLALRKR